MTGMFFCEPQPPPIRPATGTLLSGGTSHNDRDGDVDVSPARA